MENVIHPTHTCFDDALDALVELVMPGPECVPQFLLVHGICRFPSGELYAHAWVEDVVTNVCLFAGIQRGERCYFAAGHEEFYAHFDVQATLKYDYPTAFKMNREWGNYGPWNETYRALCRKPDEPLREFGGKTGETM